MTKWKCLQRLSETSVWQVRLSEVHQQIVPDSRSSCTESFVNQVGARPTDEKRTSVSRAQSSWTGVGDEAAVVRQVTGSMSRQRLVDQGGDLKLITQTHWKPVLFVENWWDATASTQLIANQHGATCRIWQRWGLKSQPNLSLIHIWRCRRSTLCRSRWSPYH